MRVLKFCKKIIYKLCGKARWLLLAFVLLLSYALFTIFCYASYPYLQGVSDNYGNYIHEVPYGGIDMLSINNSGTMIAVDIDPGYGVTAISNIDSGEQEFCGISMVSAPDPDSIDAFFPTNFAVADNGDIYAVKFYLNDNLSSLLTRETIVRLSSDYKFLDEVYRIDYDASDRLRESRLSALHFHDGYLTFAEVGITGVTLYEYNTETLALSVSEIYPTDADGTFTVNVIPVDGAFIFVRSDGNVYQVAFNEPMGESIYTFDLNAGSNTPYFSDAAISNGKLYVSVDYDPEGVYLLENGTLTSIVSAGDLGENAGEAVALGSYRPEGASQDSLVIAYENELLTYSGGELTSKSPVFHPRFTPLMYVSLTLTNLFVLPLIGLIINLIIRRKTLLYKQLIITIPIFVIMTIIIAVSVYNYVDSGKRKSVENDITMISELAAKQFDGYDFSGLMNIDEDTGAAYLDLRNELSKISSNRSTYWSEGYVFSIVYRNDDNTICYLAGDDSFRLPMRDQETLAVPLPSSGTLTSNTFSALSDDVIESNSIFAFTPINDKDSSGRYYLKVTADYTFLYSDRSGIWYDIVLYSIGMIVVLVLLIMFSLMYITRMIRKATNTLKKISDGDLSARINYKSKDELGEICSQVDDMAVNLQTSFEEKDRTEKFYYKFVPEKFREYLGKSSFTDLSLGDASSRELTVLFCDIRSFSINSEIMTAKENFAFVNTIYGKAGPIIREHNGFVDKYIGDAVMALFESPDDAVACGADLYRAIVLDPKTAQELNVRDINIGIGIHTGMAMIGIVGETERLSGTVISDTVNLSSRLESLTKQLKTAILVSKDTVDRLASPDDVNLRYLGMVQVAGVNEVKGVYEVLDCLKDDVRKVRCDNNSDFREALRLFQLGRRDDASDALEKLVREGRADYIATMYLEYIRSLSSDDKSNVFRFVRK